MALVAIDPGLVCTGWALFREAMLVGCGIAEGGEGDLWQRGQRIMDTLKDPVPNPVVEYVEVVVEKPRIYQQRKQKGDPNDLVDLGILAGLVVRAVNPHAARLVLPRDWKGTIPKERKLEDYLVHQRTLKALTHDEIVIYKTALAGMAASKRHNMADAVGLGLWACKAQRGQIVLQSN